MMQNDPFSSYRINKPVQPTFQESPKLQVSEDQDPFSSYRIQNNPKGDPKQGEENWPQYLKRNATRLGSRVAETIGGIPGEIEEIGNLIQSGTFDFLESSFGKTKFDKEEGINRKLPTSRDLNNKSIELSKGYTAPKDESEKLADEFTSTVSSLLGPMKFRKALGMAALGTGVRKGTEILGLGETSQEAAKLGTMVVSSMINPKGVKQLYTNLYNEAESFVPKGTTVPSKPLEDKLYKLRDKLSLGIEAPTEKAVIDDIDKVLQKVKNGRLEVNEMMATNRSINEKMGDPEILKRGKNLYPQVKKAVNDSINEYTNPEFKKAWKGANEAFSGVHESQKISRYISKTVGNKPITTAILTGIAETAAGYPEAVIPTIAASLVGYGGVKGVELMQRIASNPTLRKYYMDVIINASKENSTALIKSVNNLEKSIKDDDEHQSFRHRQKNNP